MRNPIAGILVALLALSEATWAAEPGHWRAVVRWRTQTRRGLKRKRLDREAAGGGTGHDRFGDCTGDRGRRRGGALTGRSRNEIHQAESEAMTRKAVFQAVAGLVALFLCAKAATATPLFENSGFELGTYKNWSVDGKAFEGGPTEKGVVPESDVTGSVKKGLGQNWQRAPHLYKQPDLSGCDNKVFANSFHPEMLNRAKGSLTSVLFDIEKDYITFQLAGGGPACDGLFAVNLLVDEQIVRQALPKGDKFTRCTFDVRALKGKKARLRIYDEQDLLGGWIAAGGFRGADAPADGPWINEKGVIIKHVSETRSFHADKRYLNIPATGAFPDDAVKLIVDGRVVQEICMSVCDEADAQFWQFIDLELWQRKDVTLTMAGWSASAAPLGGVALDDVIRGLDNRLNEPNRPQFHFTPIQGWNNDVNGTVYYDGEYHLFYQYDPSRGGAIGRNMHWGHAVSKDLFHWKHLPLALGVDPERGQNYSGSAIVDTGNVAGFQQGKEKTMIAFYTRHKPYRFLSYDFDVDTCDQCMAVSTDRGRTWTHVDKPAVAGITALNRDPKVFFHEESRKWIMVFFIHGGYDFYASENLKDWTRQSHAKGFHECPDVFQLAVDGDLKRKKWLVVNGNGEYSLGNFDGKAFSVESRGRSVFGPSYATQTFANAPDGLLRRVQMSWLRVAPRGVPFQQMISLPVELTLRTTDEGVRLFAEPAREIDGLRAEARTFPDADLSKGPLAITALPWQLMDIELTVDFNGAAAVELGVWGHRVRYGAGRGSRPVPAGGKLRLRILVDRSTIDICEQDGRAFVMGGLQADRRKPAFEASADDGKAVIRNLKIHRLKSVWGNEG
ncbi:MAG: glycoside hydrolase family 32 protein [Kiritimatiellaeota bacterium]|nr:glycoside hydrolase family 32 protein [Kiritimatiellota bacterium]